MGVAGVEAEAVVEFVLQADRQDVAFRTVRVGQLGQVADAEVLQIGVDGAAVRSGAGRQRRAELGLGQVVPDISVLRGREQVLGRHDVVVTQVETEPVGVERVVDTQRGFPVGRNFEVGRDNVDHAAGLGCDVGLQGSRNVEAGDGQAGLAGRSGRTLEGVGDPDFRIATGKQAEAAGHGRTVQAVPAEADTRLDEVETVQVLTAGAGAVGGVEIGVERRGVVLGEVLVAQAVIDRQRRGDLPGVLDEGRPLGDREGGRRVVGIVGRRVGVVDRRGVVLDVRQIVVDEVAVRGLNEQVVQLVVLVLAAEGQQVVAEGVITRGEELQALVFEFVGVTETVTAAGEELVARAIDHAGQRGARQVGFVQAEFEGRLVGAGAADLAAGEFLVVDAQRRGEAVAPVREELAGIGGQFDRDVVPGALEALTADRGAAFFGRLVGEGRTVIVRDVPVDLAQQALGGHRQGHDGRAAAHVVAELVLNVGVERVVEGRVDIVVDVVLGEVLARTGLELVIGHEEEQAVFDDRAAEREAVFFFLERRDGEGLAVRLVAEIAFVLVVVVGRTIKLVGTRLGRDVDQAAGETGHGHGIVGRGQGGGFDGVERDRGALGRVGVRTEAEIVLLQGAVDGQTVEARVGTGHEKLAFAAGEGQRVAGQGLQHVAIGRRLVGDVARGVDRADTVIQVETVDRLAGHDDHVGGLRVQRQGEGRLGAGGQVQAVDDVAFKTRGVDCDRERAADAQAGLGEVARLVGHGARCGAGRRVNDGDGGAGNPVSVGVDDFTAQRRGGLLGVDCRRRGHCRKRGHRRAVSELLEESHGCWSPLIDRLRHRQRACVLPVAYEPPFTVR